MGSPCPITIQLTCEAGVFPLAWEDSGERKLDGDSQALLARLIDDQCIDPADATTLDGFLAPLGVQRLDHRLAAARAGGDRKGFLSGVRVPTRFHPPETDELVGSDLIWWEFAIQWEALDDGTVRCQAVAKDVTLPVVMEREAKIQKERYKLAVDGTRLGT